MIIEKLQQPEVHLQCDDLTPNQKKLLAEVMLRHEMKWGLAYNRFFRFGFKEWELKGIDQIKRDFLSQHQEEIFPPNLDMSQPTSDDMVSGKGVFYRMLGMTIGMKKLFMEHMNTLGMGSNSVINKFSNAKHNETAMSKKTRKTAERPSQTSSYSGYNRLSRTR